MPGLRVCKYCKGMDKEEDMIQFDNEWIHEVCKKEYQIQLAEKNIGDKELSYKNHILSRASGVGSLWLGHCDGSEGENERLLKNKWIKEVRDHQLKCVNREQKILDFLNTEVHEFEGVSIDIISNEDKIKKIIEEILQPNGNAYDWDGNNVHDTEFVDHLGAVLKNFLGD